MMDRDKVEHTDDTECTNPLLAMSDSPTQQDTDGAEFSRAEKKMISQFQALNKQQNQSVDEEETLEMLPMGDTQDLDSEHIPHSHSIDTQSITHRDDDTDNPPHPDSPPFSRRESNNVDRTPSPHDQPRRRDTPPRHDPSQYHDPPSYDPSQHHDPSHGHEPSQGHGPPGYDDLMRARDGGGDDSHHDFPSVYRTDAGSYESGTDRPQMFDQVVDDVVAPESVELHDMGQHNYPPAYLDAESAQPEREPEECEGWGPVNFVGTYLLGLKQRLSPTRLLLLVLALIFLIGFIVFLGVFPTSFVFVQYYEIALKSSKLTGSVNREEVVYPGCYIYTPDVTLIRFNSTAETVDVQTDIFTLNKVIINIEFTLQYFIKPSEIGKLHRKFDMDYDTFIRGVVISTFKNTATQYDLDEYRLNRDRLELHFHNIIRDRLNGNCCPECCPSDCKNTTMCKSCDFRQTCYPSYHVDLRYFQLGKVGIPQAVFERFTKQTVLQIEAEREFFIQEYDVEVKKTELESQKLLNEAERILANATAQAGVLRVNVDADKEKLLTKTYVKALNRLYGRLNVTRQDHKLSLLMIRTYEDIKDNVYAYDYNKLTSRNP